MHILSLPRSHSHAIPLTHFVSIAVGYRSITSIAPTSIHHWNITQRRFQYLL
ncbi:hypothetical protein ACSBR2_017550 [Camellia fascicularis]